MNKITFDLVPDGHPFCIENVLTELGLCVNSASTPTGQGRLQ